MAEVILTINGRKIENTFTKLRRETRALERELRNLTPGTEAFTKKAEEVKKVRSAFNKVNKEISQMRKEIDKTGNFFTRFAGKLNNLPNFFAAFKIGSIIKDGLTNLKDDLFKISDAITDVQKTSGLSKQAVGELWHELSDLDTRTSKLDLMKIAEIGGRLGIQDKDELKTFTGEIDKAYVALGDSFSGGLEAVTTKLGKMKNLFTETKNLDYGTAINQIGSALNELAAQGTASEENITDFAMRVGQLPEALKPSAEKILGLGAAFEESGLTAEIASSGYSRFMLSASNNISAFAKSMGMGLTEAKKLLNEKPEEFFIRFSEGMKGLDATQTAKIFKSLKLNTQEITKVVGAAAQNSGRFYEMMNLSGSAMIKATSLVDEFNNKNNNSAAIWEKIFKTIKNIVTDGAVPEFFDWISEVFGKITGVLSENGNGVQVFTRRLLFLIKTLTVAGVTFISYRLAVLLATKSTKDLIQQTILHNTIEKVSIALKKTGTAITLLYAAAKYKLTGNTKKAAAAMRMFNTVTKLSPLGLLVGAIMAVVTAMALYSSATKKVNIERKALNDSENEASKNVASQKNELEQLLKTAQDNTKSLKERQKAVDELNRLVPEYNGHLTVESANTLDATNKLKTYIEKLKDAAREKYFKTLVDKKAEEVVKAENSSFKENIKWYEIAWNSMKNFGSATMAMQANIKTSIKNKKEWIKVSNAELETLNKLHQAQKTKNDKNNSGGPKEGDTQVINGVTYIFKGGKWLKSNVTGGNSDKKNKQTNNEHKKALDAQTKANRKLLELEQKLQDEKRQLQQDGIDKEIENISISYGRKKIKIQQENEDLQREINKTNEVIANLQTKKTNTTNPKKQKEYNDAINVYHKINQKRIDAKKINDAIIVQLESTKQFKIKKLKIKAFTEEQQRNFKKVNSKKQDAINEINSISSLEEAKEQLRDELSKKELSKIKTITQAKEVLRKEANKKALKLQINYLKTQQALLQKELQTIANPQAREAMMKQLNFLSEKLKEIRGSLQIENDTGNTPTQDTEYESLDILGFSVKQWEDTFVNLDTTKGKLKAVGMAMQALANIGTMYAQLQKANNEKELNNFTSYQEKRKKHLKWQLDSGLISQEKYAKSVQKLDTDLANKKAELEYKQAKAEKTANIIKIIGSTAVAVSQALPNLILAGIVGAMGAIQLGIATAQPLPPKPSYAKGGYTKGLGFTDETGHEVAGAVHANEYVIPEWMLNQPRVANIAGWLETKRTGTSTVFDEGGYTTTNENKTTDVVFENQDTTLLTTAIIRLNELLEKLENDGVEAFLLSDAQNGKQMHKAIKEFQKIQNKNKR